MGLWLKCPGCHANVPLSLRVCPHCGRSLDNLAPDQRVYVIAPAAGPAPGPTPPPPPPAPEVEAPPKALKGPEFPQAALPDAAPKAVKKPKKPRKKKG
jgi:hypothetical protein